MIGKINFTIPELEPKNIIGLEETLQNKVDKQEGKCLSSNDFTDELKNKLEDIQPTDTSGLLPHGGYNGTAQNILSEISDLQTEMDGKVDREAGKGLSKNDFTDEFKAKVEGLSQLAITCFGENLISSDSGNITPNPFFFQKEHNFVMPTLGVGKFLFAYIGKQLGEGVTAKINNKDLNATPVYTKDFPGMNCYLFENKIEEDGNPTFSGLGAVLKITLEELQSIYQLQIREFLDYPTWENNKWLREKIADLESRILALETKG